MSLFLFGGSFGCCDTQRYGGIQDPMSRQAAAAQRVMGNQLRSQRSTLVSKPKRKMYKLRDANPVGLKIFAGRLIHE